jgi:ankyrin repeat protein
MVEDLLLKVRKPSLYLINNVFFNASTHCNISTIKLLLQKGASVHACDDVALCCAASNGHIKVVKFLLDNGANIHARDSGPLRWAANSAHIEIVKLLIERGANYQYALNYFFKHDEFEAVKILIKAICQDELV